jgi:small-conductance mechanosensitive channel
MAELARVTKLLAEAAPMMRLLAFHAAGIIGFELQVWNATRIHARDSLVSELSVAIATNCSRAASASRETRPGPNYATSRRS